MALVVELSAFLNSRQFIMATAVLSISASALTILRNLDYRSEVALWQATVERSPNKARAHNNLGYAYFLAGQPEAARQHYLKALALDGKDYKARFNLELLDKIENTVKAPSINGTYPTD